jgi:hypothetical protein
MVFGKRKGQGFEPQAHALNHHINALETNAYDIHSKLVIKRKPFNAELIKNKLLNKEQTQKTLHVTYDEHNNQIEQVIGMAYSYGAYRRHIRTRNHLAAFIQKEYKLTDLFVKEVDLKFINRFDHYLKTKKNGNQNT